MSDNLTGTGVSLIIPFHRYGTVDFTALEKIIEHAIGNGIDYVSVLTNFNESNTLSNDEKIAISNFVIETVDQRIPIIAGINGNNTQVLIDAVKKFDFTGIEAIVPFCPYIGKVKQKGIYYHFKEIATVCPIPVYIYNTNLGHDDLIEAETVINLARDFTVIRGYIEGSPGFENVREILSRKPDDFLVLSGHDLNIIPILAMGGDGALSITANPFPSKIIELVTHGLNNSFSLARAYHNQIFPILDIIQQDDPVSAIKAIMDRMNLCSNNLRLPLVKIKKSLHYQLHQILTEFEPTKVKA